MSTFTSHLDKRKEDLRWWRKNNLSDYKGSNLSLVAKGPGLRDATVACTHEMQDAFKSTQRLESRSNQMEI